jgi:hypothetical protein
MSETPSVSVDVNATGLPTLAPDQIAAMRAAWAQHGGDPTAFDIAAGTAKPPVAPYPALPSAAPVDPAHPSGAVQIVDGMKTLPVTPNQAQQMVEALLRAGRLFGVSRTM